MSLREPRTQRILLTVALCGLGLWSFFLSDLLPFGYQPRSRHTQELRGSYETVSTELEKARRTVGSLPLLAKEHADLERKWVQAEALLPSDKEVAQLLTQITQAGEQAGVTFELFKPQTSRPQEFYNENPVDIEVEGGFHQVGVFLSRLANLQRIVNVTNLQLVGLEQKRTRGKKGEGDRAGLARTDHTVQASFTATAYSLRDPSQETPQGPPAEKPNQIDLGARRGKAGAVQAAKAALSKARAAGTSGEAAR